MLPEVEGLVAADVAILLFYSEHRWRFAAPPATVATNTPVSQSHANRRCKALEAAGLLELADERGYYRITTLGLRYMAGEVTAEVIEANIAESTSESAEDDDVDE